MNETDPAIAVKKRRAASLSVAYNGSLTLIKLIVAALTGSVSMFTEAAHSGADVIASGFALIAVRYAAQPPDEDHNYGHGKIETLAGFGEAIMLLLVVAYAVFEAIMRLINPQPASNLGLGIVVMVICSLANLIVAAYVSKTAKQTGSIALTSNSQHLMVDFWTNLGVLAALGVGATTGWHRADPVFAILLSLWIIHGAWKMCCTAFNQLVDHRLGDEELETINEILHKHSSLKGFHKLRTRRSGNVAYVDVHLEVPLTWSLVQAHELADLIEKEIQNTLAPAIATIHVDPVE